MPRVSENPTVKVIFEFFRVMEYRLCIDFLQVGVVHI
jgi:hypothetical protein